MTCQSSVDIYKNLEVYLKDYRRLILRISDSAALEREEELQSKD